jgi:hypothetical protein
MTVVIMVTVLTMATVVAMVTVMTCDCGGCGDW